MTMREAVLTLKAVTRVLHGVDQGLMVSFSLFYGDVYQYCPSSNQLSNIALSTPQFVPWRRFPRLRPFSSGLTRTTMNRPLPAPPRQYSLVENFNALTLLPAPPRQHEYDDLVESLSALALAGKKPTEKELPDLPEPIEQLDRQTTFVGGFNPLLALSAAPDSPRRPPLVPLPPGAARTTAPLEAKAPPPPPKQIPMPIPMPVSQVDKQSLTMQYALESMRLNTPTKPALAPPFTTPPRPNSNAIVSPKATSTPPLSAVTSPGSLPAVSVTPNRPRVVSAPLSSASSSPGRNTTQCSGMTKVGKQCSRQIKLPATHSFLDPTPALYCHQHKEVMINAQPGFYVQKAGSADRFVKFSRM